MTKKRSYTPKDWVYTNDCYRDGVFSQNSGVATAFALPLVYSVNAKRTVQYGARNVLPVTGQYMGGFANPDAQRQVVYAVRGHVVYNPSAWAVGNEFLWAWRIVIGKMNPDSGSLVIEPGYTLWSSAVQDIAAYRNSANALAEGRWYRSFGENTSNGSWMSMVSWSSRRGRALEDDEGLFLYLEGPIASVNTARNRVYCATLMKRPR